MSDYYNDFMIFGDIKILQLLESGAKIQAAGETQWFKQHMWRLRDGQHFGLRPYIRTENGEGRYPT